MLSGSELATQFLYYHPAHWVGFSEDRNSGTKLIVTREEKVT